MNSKALLFTIIISSTIMFSCSSENKEQKEEIIVERVLFSESPMDSIYQLTRPKVQTFKISGNKTQQIKCENGVEVLIPSQSFIDGYGNKVDGEIEISICEATELSDFVSCNLQTMSENSLLESAGMFFVDAKNDGKSLRIAEGGQISVSMPMMSEGQGFEMFTGNFSEDGQIDWQVDDSSERSYLIPFPGDLLYDNFWYGWGEAGFAYWNQNLDTTKYNPSNEEYSNTLIQTREFRDRLFQIYWATDILSIILNDGLSWDEHKEFEADDKLFDLYFSNYNTDIEVLDSMATKIVYDFLGSSKFKDWLSAESDPKHYRHWFKENYNESEYKRYLKFGSDGAKGNVPNFRDIGIDLLSQNAYDELLAKGFKKDEAIEMINYEKEKSAYSAELTRIKIQRERKEEMEKFTQETVFATSNLGWINCDRFLNDPTAGKAEMIVSIDSDKKLEYVDCSLIIPSLNVKLSAYPYKDDAYTFTKKEGVYTNLPIGRDAVIIGIAKDEESCYFSAKKIKIEDGLELTLKFDKTDKSLLKEKLDKILASN